MDTLDQFEEALAAGADLVLLDNFSTADTNAIGQVRDQLLGDAGPEANIRVVGIRRPLRGRQNPRWPGPSGAGDHPRIH